MKRIHQKYAFLFGIVIVAGIWDHYTPGIKHEIFTITTMVLVIFLVDKLVVK